MDERAGVSQVGASKKNRPVNRRHRHVLNSGALSQTTGCLPKRLMTVWKSEGLTHLADVEDKVGHCEGQRQLLGRFVPTALDILEDLACQIAKADPEQHPTCEETNARTSPTRSSIHKHERPKARFHLTLVRWDL